MAYASYRKTDIETASQGKLVVMLFNGAITFSEDAKRAMAMNDVQRVHAKLLKAQSIVTELRAALNMDAGELAENLDRVYEYIAHLLVKANIQKSPEIVDEAIGLMTSMRDTWRQLFESMDAEPAPAPRVNQHGAVAFNLQG